MKHAVNFIDKKVYYEKNALGWVRVTEARMSCGATGYLAIECVPDGERLLTGNGLTYCGEVDWIYRVCLWLYHHGWKRPFIWYKNMED